MALSLSFSCRVNVSASPEFLNLLKLSVRSMDNSLKIVSPSPSKDRKRPNKKIKEKKQEKARKLLVLTATNRTVTAQVVHFMNGAVIEAKTSEWALRKQLYSITDTCAYIGLGRVFAQRCLEFDITEMFSDIKPVEGGKVEKFLNEVIAGGVKLEEVEVYKKPNPWDQFRPEKPWEVVEE